MAETVDNLSHGTPEDLEAMVAYLKTTKPVAEPHQSLPLYKGVDARGSDVYLNNCASCHGVDGKGLKGVVAALQGNGSVTAKGPEDVIQVVLGGAAAHGTYAPMPAVGAAMSDEDVASVVNFVRQLGSNTAPGTAEGGTVGKLRKNTQTLMNGAPESSCPAMSDASVTKAVDQSGIASSFSKLTEADMLGVARDAVQKVKKAKPGIDPASLVNSIVTAYCGVLHNDTSLSSAERAVRIGQFAELVYTESDPRGYHPR
jgi:cytochrome c5